MINRTSHGGRTHRCLRNLLLRSSPGYRAGVSESVRVAVAFRWNEAGSVALDSEGKLLFPSLPSDPGMYRLAISEKDGRQPSTSGKQTSSGVASFTTASWTDAAHEQAGQRALDSACGGGGQSFAGVRTPSGSVPS